MDNRRLFSIGDFAKFARTTRDTLRYYDNIGLLSHTVRGANGYRYYSTTQLAQLNVIRTFQELGMTLEDIDTLMRAKNPDLIDTIFAEQVEEIDKKIEEWVRARKLLLTLQRIIHPARTVDENLITVQHLPATAIILGTLNDYSRGKNDYDALYDFYRNMNTLHPNLDLNYPVWGLFSKEQLVNKDWVWPSRYYFYNPEGYDKRPAGTYAIGYTRGGYSDGDELFERLLDFVEKNNLEVCGDGYKEYPLNEFCIEDNKNYLIRILVAVREKSTR